MLALLDGQPLFGCLEEAQAITIDETIAIKTICNTILFITILALSVFKYKRKSGGLYCVVYHEEYIT